MRRNHPIKEIKGIYNNKIEEIELRLNEFKEIWNKGTKEEIFAELVFCILTPMSRGKSCWTAVENMIRKGILFSGDIYQIRKQLKGARFIYKKSEYIVEARKNAYLIARSL